MVAAVLLLMVALTLAMMAISFPIGTYAVFFTHLSNSTASSQGYPFLWIGPLALVLPFEVSYGGAFLAVTAVYVAMFVLAATQGRSLAAAAKSGLGKGYREFFSNRAFLTVVAIGFLVYTAGMIDALVQATGASVGNPFTGTDDLKYFLELTLAPLREEFGFRVLIIGLAALAVSPPRPGLPSRQAVATALKTLWRPSAILEGADSSVLAVVVLWAAGALSAGTFGACHVACGGGGWEVGKLPEAVYGGIVLAYLYIRYGFHVAVLAHWGIDYFTSAYAFFGQGAFGIPWASTPGYFLQQVVASDLLGVFGLACVLMVGYAGIMKLVSRRSRPPPDGAGS